MTEQMYSHADVWLLLHSIPLMEYARHKEPKMWRKFMELVFNETAQSYADEWNTPFAINKIAEDLGSYKELLHLWLQIEEAFDDIFNPIED